MAALDANEAQTVTQVCNLYRSLLEFGKHIQEMQTNIGTDYTSVLFVPQLVTGLLTKKSRFDALNVPNSRVQDIFGSGTTLSDLNQLFNELSAFRDIVENNPGALVPEWDVNHSITYPTASTAVQNALNSRINTLLAFYSNL